MVKKQTWAEMDKSGTPLAKLIEGFAHYNRTTNKSPRTVTWYRERLGLFLRFAGEDATLKDISVPNARAFIAELQGRTTRNPNNPFYKNKDRPLSSAYVQSFARALRAFSSWLYEDGYADTNVLRPLKPPKVQQKVVGVLSDAEIERLLSVFDRNDPYGARNYAIVFTMLDAGLRATELLDLSLANARLQEGFLKVLGKGNKERLIPVERRSQEALRTWLERFRLQFDPEGTEPPLPECHRTKDDAAFAGRNDRTLWRSGAHIQSPSSSAPAHVRNKILDPRPGRYVPVAAASGPYEP